jgi:hypothetical protein
MNISRNKEDGFKLDVPYSQWLIFCVGAAVRWW